MGIVLALLLGTSGSCCDGKCPTTPPPAVVCEDGQCEVKSSSKKVSPTVKAVAAAKAVRKSVFSRYRIFRRRR